ncbi:MAG: diguanylate cyclase [Bermanella sp.]|jgi:diguanylate cyclase
MSKQVLDITEFHWMMDMLQTIDVGLVVLDADFNVQVWNSFMENHSGLSPDKVKGKSLFASFNEIPENWLRKKVRSVFLLKNRTFTTWEQRPFVFKFKNYRPITGTAKYMYQNTTFIPLSSTDGCVKHMCMIIYDVTDIAVNKLALNQLNVNLKNLSRTDQLTQLNNRGYWEDCLNHEFARSIRYDTVSSLLMFDIDHFKQVNDQYGHPAGDKVIRQVATTLKGMLRSTDIAGRYGGEEFGVILAGTHGQEALLLAERLRAEIAALKIQADGQEITFTISIGIGEISPKLSQPIDWLKQSDTALYYCKENGRNCCALYDPHKMA